MDNIFLVHLFELNEGDEVKTWFRTSDEMSEFLCGVHYAYAHEFGQIRSHLGHVIGKWVIAEIE